MAHSPILRLWNRLVSVEISFYFAFAVECFHTVFICFLGNYQMFGYNLDVDINETRQQIAVVVSAPGSLSDPNNQENGKNPRASLS